MATRRDDEQKINLTDSLIVEAIEVRPCTPRLTVGQTDPTKFSASRPRESTLTYGASASELRGRDEFPGVSDGRLHAAVD